MKKLIQKSFALLVLLFGINALNAQTWFPVGGGLPGNWGSFEHVDMVSKKINNEIHVAVSVSNSTWTSSSTVIYKWNGIAWTTTSPVPTNDFYVSDMAAFNNRIYISGWNQSGTAIYEFDNGTWSAFSPSGFIGSVSALDTLGGELYLGGNFNSSVGTHIMKFSNGNFSAAPTLPPLSYVKDLEVLNNELYVSGNDSSKIAKSVLKLSGNSWYRTSHFIQGTGATWGVAKLFTYQNNLYAYNDSYSGDVHLVSNDTLFFKGKMAHHITGYTEYNNEIYFSGDTADFSGGPYFSKFNGNLVTPIYNSPKTLGGVETYNGNLVVISKTDLVHNSIVGNRTYQSGGNLSTISGKVFNDLNGDCILNPNEDGVAHQGVSFGQGIVASTNLDGDYSLGLAPGTYPVDSLVSLIPGGKNFKVNCSVPSQITLSSNQNLIQNFPMSNNVATDLSVQIVGTSGWRARYGFTETYFVNVTNTGNSTMLSSTLKVELPTSVSLGITNPIPNSQTGNVLSYNLVNIQPYETKSFYITATIDTSQNSIGDSILFSTYIMGLSGDADSTDNSSELIQEVRGAYDPNDKQASHATINVNTNSIDYHIRFQNTGNDTAYKVTVVDTLATNLPLTSVMINSTSHPYNLSVVNNVLIWEFDNILLPDSTTDLAGSQGYVNFSTAITPGLAVGDSILNKAEIYFDFQHPIITNHAKTVVVQDVLSVGENEELELIKVYPNPAQDVVFIENIGSVVKDYSITDMAGREVMKFELLPSAKTEIDISNLDVGVYILRSGKALFKLVVTD